MTVNLLVISILLISLNANPALGFRAKPLPTWTITVADSRDEQKHSDYVSNGENLPIPVPTKGWNYTSHIKAGLAADLNVVCSHDSGATSILKTLCLAKDGFVAAMGLESKGDPIKTTISVNCGNIQHKAVTK